MKRRLITSTLALVMAVAALLGVTATTASAQGTRPCAPWSYCFFEDANYGGWKLSYRTTNYGLFVLPPNSSRNAKDKVSSVINNTRNHVCLYNFGIFGGRRLLFEAGPYQDVPWVGDANNDQADYWRVVPYDAACPSK